MTSITQVEREKFFLGDEETSIIPKINQVGFRRLNSKATIPLKAHETDSGFDLTASENIVIEPGQTAVVPTGIAVQLPQGYEAQVRPRSGVTSKTELRVQLGTIDNGYTGEVGVIVDNISGNQSDYTSYVYRDVQGGLLDSGSIIEGTYYEIKKGDRIAQLVVQKLPNIDGIEVFDVKETDRGNNGYGSTGVNVK